MAVMARIRVEVAVMVTVTFTVTVSVTAPVMVTVMNTISANIQGHGYGHSWTQLSAMMHCPVCTVRLKVNIAIKGKLTAIVKMMVTVQPL